MIFGIGAIIEEHSRFVGERETSRRFDQYYLWSRVRDDLIKKGILEMDFERQLGVFQACESTFLARNDYTLVKGVKCSKVVGWP